MLFHPHVFHCLILKGVFIPPLYFWFLYCFFNAFLLDGLGVFAHHTTRKKFPFRLFHWTKSYSSDMHIDWDSVLSKRATYLLWPTCFWRIFGTKASHWPPQRNKLHPQKSPAGHSTVVTSRVVTVSRYFCWWHFLSNGICVAKQELEFFTVFFSNIDIVFLMKK